MKKTVVFIFSHPTLLNVWQKAAKLLETENITILIVNQSSQVDWNENNIQKIEKADAVYFSGIRHFNNFNTIASVCLKTNYVLPSGIEASSFFEYNDELSSMTIDNYLKAGSAEDLANAARFMLYKAGKNTEKPISPSEPVLCGIYDRQSEVHFSDLSQYFKCKEYDIPEIRRLPIVAICFPRSWILSEDMELIDALTEPLLKRNLLPLTVFCDGDIASQFGISVSHPLDALLSDCNSSLSSIWYCLSAHTSGGDDSGNPFIKYNVPVFQIIRNYNQTISEWKASDNGLSAVSICYSLTRPEMTGCIEPSILACNEMVQQGFFEGKTYRSIPVPERIDNLAERAAKWDSLRTRPNSDKKIAIMLHNAPCKGVEATLATAAGLDAAESAVRVMQRLKDEGYIVSDIPASGRNLINEMLSKKAVNEFRWTNTDEIHSKGGTVAEIYRQDYMENFLRLPKNVQDRMNDAWGEFPGEAMVYRAGSKNPCLLVTGIWFGNILVMLEPKRGCRGPKCDGEVCRILHEPDIPPPHHWLASYWYLQNNVDALVSLGAESPLEYLPGKRAALSEECYPEISLGSLPVIYPYIFSSIGEGLIAKRRGRAVLIDHLTPPIECLTDSNGCWTELESLYAQYYNALTVNDYGRLSNISSQLKTLMTTVNLLESDSSDELFRSKLMEMPGRIRQLKKRYIEKKSHIFGEIPDEASVRLYLNEAKGTCNLNIDEKILRTALGNTTVELDNLVRSLSGGFIEPGPGGHLSRGKTDILPTGRNFYGIDLKAIPTIAAWKTGSETGRLILAKYLDEEGRFPESVAITLWSSDVFRSEGELVSQGLWLCGCRPVWAHGGRVSGIEIIPANELTMTDNAGNTISRPRVDIIIQISGVVRDTLPNIYEMLDKAIEIAAAAQESDTVNYVRVHVEKQIQELKENLADTDAKSLNRLARCRVFSSKSGSYGTGIGLAIDASAWNDDKDLAEAYINWTGFAFGNNLEVNISSEKRQSIIFSEYSRLLASVDITYQKAIGPEYDALSCGCYSSFQGGMAAVNRAGGSGKAKMYWGDSSSGPLPEIRSLSEEIDESLFAKLLNPDWLNEKKKDGYTGAHSVSGMINTLFHWAATSRVVTDEQFNATWQMYIDNNENRSWLQSENIYTLEEITRRLLEAASRRMWDADEEKIVKLQEVMLTIEGEIEESMGSVEGEFQGSSVDIKTRKDVSKWKYDFTFENQFQVNN